jgi:hypothetical protein
MPAPIDVLILGGGIQGLALLREVADDLSALLIGGDSRVSETLHFHGYFSSGWNATHLEAARIYRQAAAEWSRLLTRYALSPHQTSFHAALPPQTVAALQSNWQAAQIDAIEEPFPAPLELGGLPKHRVFRFVDDLVFDGAAAFARFQEPVADRTRVGRAVGFQRDGNRIAQVTVKIGDETVKIEPTMVLAACGAGNAQILKSLNLSAETVRNAQLARPLHMVLARGARLPSVSGFLLDLVVVHHPLNEQEGLWIVTLNPAKPKFTAGVVEMEQDPAVEPALVRATLEKLASVMPDFDRLAAGWQWDVYVGWKTDAPGPRPGPLLNVEYPLPYGVLDFGMENFVAVWPNHWCLATPAAAAVGRTIRTKLAHNHDQPDIPEGGGLSADSRRERWRSSDRQWQDWAQFAARFGYKAG